MKEVMASGLLVPEGPALFTEGIVTFTEQMRGAISRFNGTQVETVAITGGAPNAAVLGSDGFLYVCQNGGVVASWRSPEQRTPGIQRVSADGSVETLATSVAGRVCVTPNDLAFGADGRLYFTDPAQPFDNRMKLDTGRICALDSTPDSPGEEVLHVGPVYCNGIGFDQAGRLIWVESYTRCVCTLDENGGRTVLCRLPEGHIPDGFAVAEDGRIFIATCGSHGISVVDSEGNYLGLIYLDESADPTNCCFDGSALWITDFGMDFESQPDSGRLWRIDTDAVGAEIHYGVI